MGMFTPAYYNQKKSFDEREKALQKEKNEKRLRKAAADPSIDGRLRAAAITKLRDPSLCEALLMEREQDPVKKPDDLQSCAYQAAARSLAEMGEQPRLERIFHQCGNYAIRSIVVSSISSAGLLEEAAINPGEKFGPDPWYTKVAQAAVSRITDDAALARVAIRSFHAYPGEDAAKRVSGEDQLRSIALQSPYIGARIHAVRRMKDPGALIQPLREEWMPVIAEAPMDSCFPAIFLALCGDPAAKAILYFTGSEKMGVRAGIQDCGSRSAESAALNADPEFLLPVLKKILEALMAEKDHKTRELIPRVAKCLRLMHENRIAPERIEADFPRTIQYDFEYTDYAGDDYDSGDRKEGAETISLW